MSHRYARACGYARTANHRVRLRIHDGHRVIYHEPICPDCGSFD